MTDFITDAVRNLTGPAFRLIHRIVGDREEARDLTQDLFVRLLREPERIRGEIRPYLMQAAYHAALNARRNRRRKDAAHDNLRMHHESNRPEDPGLQFEAARTREQLADAVGSLAEKQREAVTLRFFGEMTMREIAIAMKITEGSVRVHLARALQNLRTHLTPLLDKE